MLNKYGYIQSFGRRKGRPLGSLKVELLDDVLPKYEVDLDNFTLSGETWLEIGCGSGEHVAGQAKMNPQVSFIAAEPYLPGVASLLKHITDNQLYNIRIWTDDVRFIFPQIADGALSKVYILFPDPWPKPRHHKRRLISTNMLDLLASKLKKGGKLIIATDHVDYANWIMFHVAQNNKFQLDLSGYEGLRHEPKGWIKTKYQQKAEEQGMQPFFFVLNRI